MLPYDNNRVPLEEDVDGTDYINASWVNNEQTIGDKAFCNKLIAAQNPLAKTIAHFLQMIIRIKYRQYAIRSFGIVSKTCSDA